MTAHRDRAEPEVTLSVRETRMIVERILLASGLPDGFVPAVGNCVIYSQAMQLGGLAAFESSIAVISESQLSAIRLVQESPEACVVDGGRNHAWLVVHDALDLAVASYRRGGAGLVEVRNVQTVAEARVVEGLAQRHGARAEVTIAEGVVGIKMVADQLPGPDRLMEAALRHGFPVTHELWRTLYDRSSAALTPDSLESRRHAGPVMVDAEGRVHGRDDDDTDFELLVGQPAGLPGASERA
jgi:hypothetical protein